MVVLFQFLSFSLVEIGCSRKDATKMLWEVQRDEVAEDFEYKSCRSRHDSDWGIFRLIVNSVDFLVVYMTEKRCHVISVSDPSAICLYDSMVCSPFTKSGLLLRVGYSVAPPGLVGGFRTGDCL